MKVILNKLNRYYRSAYKTSHFPSLIEIFNSDKKIFAYYGYLGDNNFGDELVFESAKMVFKPDILLPVRKFMPVSLRLFCFFFKSRFAGLVIGGGTLIGPFWHPSFFLKLLNLKKPVYIHGTGVHKIVDRSQEWKSVFGGHVYGGVRGCLSKDNLRGIYPPIKITGDAAFAFFDKTYWNFKRNGQNNVLINLGTHFDYEGQDFSRIEFKKFIKSLIENGYNVQFLPFHLIDHQLGEQLKLEFPEIVLLEQPENFISAVNIFQNCSFAIGERLHFTVMAILTKSPFVSLNYGKKHEDLLQSMELSHAGLQPANFSFSSLNNIFNSRTEFDWGSAETLLSNFKEIQINEASDFIVKN